jgi:hypothetical protein
MQLFAAHVSRQIAAPITTRPFFEPVEMST